MNHLNMIRQKNPLIYNITNQVVKNFTANGLLALGASPAMANAPEEAEEMVRQADCLVLNIGTVSKNQVEAMLLAGREANKNNIPVILDPVAVGATTFRTNAVKTILKHVSLTAIRGNAGEIATIFYEQTNVKGVDSLVEHLKADVVKNVAKTYQTNVIATGKKDLLSNGRKVFKCINQASLLPYLTGSGCLLSAVIGAFIAVSNDPFIAIKEAVIGYSIAGDLAQRKATGPGTFLPAFIDALYHLEHDDILKYANIKEIKGETDDI